MQLSTVKYAHMLTMVQGATPELIWLNQKTGIWPDIVLGLMAAAECVGRGFGRNYKEWSNNSKNVFAALLCCCDVYATTCTGHDTRGVHAKTACRLFSCCKSVGHHIAGKLCSNAHDNVQAD